MPFKGNDFQTTRDEGYAVLLDADLLNPYTAYAGPDGAFERTHLDDEQVRP